ncbi:DUF1642 domain-containing protein [Listeria monocytogenes]|nr:DUF1642 domain-containing protein [Listeria monocytogenes]ECK9808486.1 DUF1642 domain-containing protein [Listeria monocytogenes]EHB1568820.1 DUF1642 domain-containing protein [Listeria monocytogenes]EHD5147690.1 DUF1642 domain-containing protein [Listeria monocytogenes]EHG5572009.1 DUF1642 domain-containing protein [Listeria monocytogenes]
MRFKTGDRVELNLRSKKRVGTVEEVYNDTQKCKVQIDGFPVTVTKLQKYLVKAEEQERIVVPQCVADWYEKYNCALEYSIWKYIYEWADQDYESDFYSFMNHACNNPIETLIKMKYGYEVEKEPLYYVKLIDQATGYLNVRNDGRRSMSNSVQNEIFKTKFTESEIKAMDKGEVYWLLREPVEEVEGEDNE